MSTLLTGDARSPLACVIGDMDLMRPLGLAGIPCASIAAAGSPVWYSRFSRARLPWGNAWECADELVSRLVAFGESQAVPPVLFYQHDSDLMLVSRNRQRLERAFRFVVPEAELVEDLVDKGRFQALAQRLALPVPRAIQLDPTSGSLSRQVHLRYPLIVKPVTRRQSRWSALGNRGKAVRVDSPRELEALWTRASRADIAIMVQELVAGDESSIESYHVYVDMHGNVVCGFTGRKLRTYPKHFGDSTALVTTDAEEVSALGRQIVRRLQLRGVAKLDFKRGSDGELKLLEVNPRFTLWHHLGALAGVNIPAQVYGDLTDRIRETPGNARSGVRWCRMWPDVKAARDEHLSFVKWMTWTMACEAKSTVAWDDPGPLLMTLVDRVFRRHTPRTHGFDRHAENRDTGLSRRH